MRKRETRKPDRAQSDGCFCMLLLLAFVLSGGKLSLIISFHKPLFIANQPISLTVLLCVWFLSQSVREIQLSNRVRSERSRSFWKQGISLLLLSLEEGELLNMSVWTMRDLRGLKQTVLYEVSIGQRSKGKRKFHTWRQAEKRGTRCSDWYKWLLWCTCLESLVSVVCVLLFMRVREVMVHVFMPKPSRYACHASVHAVTQRICLSEFNCII